MERIRQLMGRVSFFWSSLKGWHKAALGGAAFLALVLLGLLTYWAGRPAYDPLFTGLEVDDEDWIARESVGVSLWGHDFSVGFK